MVAVTYGVSRVAAPPAAETKTGTTNKGFFARVFDAIAESQMKRAEREIARHRHLLPPNFEINRNLWPDHEAKLPFGGW